MSEDILVRLDGPKTIVTVVSSFEDTEHEAAYNEAFREYSALFAALYPLTGLLAALGGSNASGKRAF
jgi:hypothetical protein